MGNVEYGSSKHETMESIMKCEYFKGLSQLGKEHNQYIVGLLCKYNCYAYFDMILKYFDKNKEAIVNGLKCNDNGQSAAMILLKHKEPDLKVVKLCFQASKKTNIEIIVDETIDTQLMHRWNMWRNQYV